jgi:hypothetical protein
MTAKSNIGQLGAATLVEHVQKNEQLRRVARAVIGGDRRVDISGLRGSAPAFVVEALRATLGRPIIVCCPDEETARDVRADLQRLSRRSASQPRRHRRDESVGFP